MRKLKLTKVIGSLLIAASVLALNPIGASAEWRQDDNGWWYADGSSWSIGRKRIGQNVYYFDANGYMSTGWKEINGKWNYFDDNGCQKTGWMQYEGKWYFMAPDGSMFTNTAADGWYLNNEGIGTKCINIGGFQIDKATGTIVRYKGNDTSLVIPSELEGIEIKSIGFMAFNSCDKLTSITIPSSVTDIGFLNCKSLTSIIVDDNNKNYTSVDGVLFNKSKTELVKCPQGRRNTGYIIPDSVTSIRRQAFYNCIGLTSITISDKVTSIGETAFYNCSGLTNITIPDSVTSIGGGAFSGCTGLTSITIANKVTSIGETTFYNCSSLTNITIPDSVTSIGVGAFAGCTSLTRITIPDSVTSIETKNKRGPNIANPFYNCTNVIIYVNSEKTKQLLVNSGVKKSVIILNGQSSAVNQNASANINNVSTKVNENGNE